MDMVGIPRELRRGNWEWSDRGLTVTVISRAGRTRVFLPVQTVDLIAGQELASQGVGAEYGVGAPVFSVGGFFSKLKKGLKKLARKVKKKARKLVPRSVRRIASKIAKTAVKVVRHPAFRAGFAALATAVPVLAPAAAGLEIANQVLDRVDDAKKAARKIQQGIKTVKTVAQVVQGKKSVKALGSLMRLAAQGHPKAKKAVGAFYAAKMVREQVAHATRRGPKRSKSGRAGAIAARARAVAAQRKRARAAGKAAARSVLAGMRRRRRR